MGGTQAQVVEPAQAHEFWEGAERCLEYLRDRDMWFGTSTLEPGETGATDPGHPGSTEVFYCAHGTVVVDDGTERHELGTGSALLIPQGVPHTLSNVGEDTALVVWAGAPGEGA